MAHNNEVGKRGEDIATTYLTNLGYAIVEKNYRYGRMEIDIIAKTEDKLIFVEVKTRSNRKYGYPEMAVGSSKMDAIFQGAEIYMESIGWDGFIRFDIIAIVLEEPIDIVHFKDAF